MSATTAPTPVTPNAPFRPGRISRAVAAFSGPPGLVIKIVLLSVMNALGLWAAYVLANRHHWVALPILVASTLAIDAVYLLPRRWTLPLKFLIPGTVFLVAFQIVPVIYTIEIAFSNYSTGHVIDKASAIEAIKINSLQPPANGKQYEAAPARDSSGNLVLLLRDDTSGRRLRRHEEGADAAREERRDDLARHVAADRRQGLHPDQGRRALHARQGARRAPHPDARRRGDPGAGRRAGRRAAADAALRRREEPVRADQRRRRVHRQRTRLVRQRPDELEPGWKTLYRLPQLRQARHRPSVSQPLPEDPHLDVRVCDDHGARRVRDGPRPRDPPRQERACASSVSTARR